MSTTDAQAGEASLPRKQPATKPETHPRSQRPAEGGSEKHGEEYFRDRMGQLEERLELDQRELTVLNQKLGQSQMMYYSDPVQGLLQSSGPTAMSDVHSLQGQIDAKQADVAKDQEAIDDLHEELRRAGGDPGWLRNVPPGEPGQHGSTAEGKGGKDWDARFKLARARLADAEEQLRVSQDELKLLGSRMCKRLTPASKQTWTGRSKTRKTKSRRNKSRRTRPRKLWMTCSRNLRRAARRKKL